MSRTNKGGKPLGWEYWGKRKGGSWVDRETSHKIERMQLKEELHNLIKLDMTALMSIQILLELYQAKVLLRYGLMVTVIISLSMVNT